MFGLLYTLFTGGALAAGSIRDRYYNEDSAIKAKATGEDYYLDRRGIERLASNGHRCMNRWNEKGHCVLRDIETDRVVRDYTEEESERNKKRAIELGLDVYVLADRVGSDPQKSFEIGYCKYNRKLKNIKTGEIYIPAEHKHIYRKTSMVDESMYDNLIFYMDSDGRIISEHKRNEEKLRNNYNKKNKYDFIRFEKIIEILQEDINEHNKKIDDCIKNNDKLKSFYLFEPFSIYDVEKYYEKSEAIY